MQPSPREAVVVLVVLDGVREQEIFEGAEARLSDERGLAPEERPDAAHLIPNLLRLRLIEGAAEGGAGTGSVVEASGPEFVSKPGYMELLTGRSDTGCLSNDCDRVPFPTVADDVARRPGRGAVVVSSWSGIDSAASVGGSNVLVSVGSSAGEGRAALAKISAIREVLDAADPALSPAWGAGFRSDELTGRLALAVLRTRTPTFLFVGLGETDEYADADDYRGYLAALTRADAIIGRIWAELRARNARGQSCTLFVTTDHGRAHDFKSHGKAYPESARVWMIAAGAGIAAKVSVTSPVHRRLADIGQTIRFILGVPLSNAPHAGDPLAELLTPEYTALLARTRSAVH